MRAKKIVSRKAKKNNITIILELENESGKQLTKEIKKAIRKWNHLLRTELGFKIIVFESGCNHLEE